MTAVSDELLRRADSAGWHLDSWPPQAAHVVKSVAKLLERADVRGAGVLVTSDGFLNVGERVQIPAAVAITLAT